MIYYFDVLERLKLSGGVFISLVEKLRIIIRCIFEIKLFGFLQRRINFVRSLVNLHQFIRPLFRGTGYLHAFASI